MAIPEHEWLAAAKRQAIGSKRRIRHGREPTAAMDVGNESDRYWCYCHRCHKGGVVMKEHVRYATKLPTESHTLTLPTDMIPVSELDPHLQDGVYKFLLEKHMHPAFFPDGSLLYSHIRRRLVFKWQTKEGTPTYMGRDTTGLSPQKWLTYTGHTSLSTGYSPFKRAVVVEDAFSFLKVRHAMDELDWEIHASLGTAVRAVLATTLMHNPRIAMFYDGDKAGISGAFLESRRFRALGSKAIPCCAPYGMDPKDMTIEQIRNHLQELKWTS